MTSVRSSLRVDRRVFDRGSAQPLSEQSANDSPRSECARNASGRHLTASRRALIAARLSERDRAVVSTLRQHRLATGDQLGRLHFAGISARERRIVLTRLANRRVLARLPRAIGGVRSGSLGYVYALDVVGQHLTDGLGPARGFRVRRPWQPGPSVAAHTLAVTELRVRLAEAERRHHLVVEGFEPEPNCWRRYLAAAGAAAVLKPDAALELAINGHRDSWFIEVDRGTESPFTLAKKAEAYVAYWRSGQEEARQGVFPRVLFIVPDAVRHDVVVEVLARQRPEAWPLFAVATFDGAIQRLEQGAHL